jgi:hypothetical protein
MLVEERKKRSCENMSFSLLFALYLLSRDSIHESRAKDLKQTAIEQKKLTVKRCLIDGQFST